MWPTVEELVARAPASGGEVIGRSREGRRLEAFRIGDGARRVSLIGGCHADEPVGPWLLEHVVTWLLGLPRDHPAATDYTWWVCPHVNPDGREKNLSWTHRESAAVDVAAYVDGVVRELPGDDVEFGFPRDDADPHARPEPTAVHAWWRRDPRPFHFHASLHGMAFAGGPWFLVEPSWRNRVDVLYERCHARTRALGYVFHDIDRGGEKGFHRIGPGFSIRPSSDAMRDHFLALRDPRTAARFRPSSMETVRRWGGDPLTLVSEVPLFVTPGVSRDLRPDAPERKRWRERIDGWRREVSTPGGAGRVRREAEAAGLKRVPVRDQMSLQWEMVIAGLEAADIPRPSPAG